MNSTLQNEKDVKWLKKVLKVANKIDSIREEISFKELHSIEIDNSVRNLVREVLPEEVSDHKETRAIFMVGIGVGLVTAYFIFMAIDIFK